MRKLIIPTLLTAGLTTAIVSCHNEPETSSVKDDLVTRNGYLDWMDPVKVRSLRDSIPAISDTTIESIVRDPNTMWYDEASMVFVYQDSVETVVGVRANRVGREVGERNRGTDIARLLNYFGEDKRFKFPFRKAAGTDDVHNEYVVNFWKPPVKNGEVLPVKWWKQSSRGRWNWVFPNGTVFGEVLFQKSPSGKLVPFEVRVRKRYSAGWAVDLFRPFTNAGQLASRIKSIRPNWESNSEIRSLVNHLENNTNLSSHRLESEAFGRIFEPIDGALDLLPAVSDHGLIEELLAQPFQSAEGEIWKTGNGKETYGPGSQGDFHIVPKGYTMGMIPVNEVSCNRCHQDTGRYLGEMDSMIQLYGEIWGEDRIFTWHLFKDHRGIYGTFDDADGSRLLNPRLQQSGLIEQGRIQAGDPDYKELPRRYTVIFR